MSGDISPSAYTPPTEIVLTAEQAKKIRINENVKITVEGKATGIRQRKNWDEKKKKDVVVGYVVELDKSSAVNIQTNPAAAALEDMKEGS